MDRVSLAGAGLLVAFVLAFLELWRYLVGLPFFLAVLAPSNGNIERRRRALLHAGS
ncbi:MAG TPA: hypothetical protein VM784_12690 [Actinomycetota bacterium]|nr:hypothetical protein [Actinomycetota bacterium]